MAKVQSRRTKKEYIIVMITKWRVSLRGPVYEHVCGRSSWLRKSNPAPKISTFLRDYKPLDPAAEAIVKKIKEESHE